jgi:hypothetical protein
LWDIITACNLMKELKAISDVAQISQEFEFIGMDQFTETLQTNRYLSEINLKRDVPLCKNTIEESLRLFYEKFCDINIEDFKKIKSGCMISDSLIQKMIIPPQHLKRFNYILNSSKNCTLDYIQRIKKKAAREYIQIEHLSKSINKNLSNDQKYQETLILLLIDRDLVSGLIDKLSAEGWMKLFK